MAALLVANYPQMPLFVKLAALLGANYPQMPPYMKLGTFLVAHYCMLSANSAITDINKTSMLPIRRPLLLTMSINGNFFVVSDLCMSQTKHLLSLDNLNIVLFYCLIVSLNNIGSLITTLNVEL